MVQPMKIDVLLKQIKQKEEQDDAYARRIKECETVIKTEEESIKHLENQLEKLKHDNNRKLLENSKQETEYEILQGQKGIWIDILEKKETDLQEAQAKLENLQQSVCLDRTSFCDNVREFIDKHNWMDISRGFVKRHTSTRTTKAIKIEEDEDEYNKLFESNESLENQLQNLIAEEAQIEEAKRLKAQLQAEPSSGENFLRLQNALKDVKDRTKALEEHIKTVKRDIDQKELLILRRKNSNIFELNQNYSQDIAEESHKADNANKATTSQKIETSISGLKIVKFKDCVEKKQISPQIKGILKTRVFTPKSPSPHLRRTLLSNLDKEMKEILSKKKE